MRHGLGFLAAAVLVGTVAREARGAEPACGRFVIDVEELLELTRRGVIDTRPITTKHFGLEQINDALDYIEERGENDHQRELEPVHVSLPHWTSDGAEMREAGRHLGSSSNR